MASGGNIAIISQAAGKALAMWRQSKASMAK